MGNGGFGLARARREGAMIDPETNGAVETPEREAELKVYYAQLERDYVAFERSFAGKWARFRGRVYSAWHAWRGDRGA